MSSEIEWSDHPEPVSPGQRPELIRCGQGSLPAMICISTRHCGGDLHYWQGRSFPHLKKDCPACASKNVAVWKGYLGVWNPSTRLTGILEFTLRCVSALDAYFLAHGTCRGATIVMKRNGTKPNGKLNLTATTSQWGLDQLPEEPNIRTQLSMMWGSKRQDELINIEPTRPVVDPPETTAEVLAKRATVTSHLPIDVINRLGTPLSDAGAALAAGFAEHNPGFKRNGRHK